MTMTDDTNVDVCGGLEATAEQLDDLLHLLLRGEGDWMMADTKVPRHLLREQRHLRTWVVSPGYPLACVKLVKLGKLALATLPKLLRLVNPLK